MPIPQVTDRVKEAPAMALRAVFAGIGQLLMAVDKIRAQMQEQATSSAAPAQQQPSAKPPPQGQADGTSNVTVLRERAAPTTKPGAGPGATRPGATTKATAGTKLAAAPKSAAGAKSAAGPKPAAGAKSAAGTKPATGPKSAAGTKSAAGPKPAAGPKSAAGTKLGAEGKPAAGTKPGADAAPPAPSSAPAALTAPIPGYDDLSVASLRARLRGLDAAGVQALLDYEKANARRDDVITMFERRLSKIENGTS
jgi:hypothetical protein